MVRPLSVYELAPMPDSLENSNEGESILVNESTVVPRLLWSVYTRLHPRGKGGPQVFCVDDA